MIRKKKDIIGWRDQVLIFVIYGISYEQSNFAGGWKVEQENTIGHQSMNSNDKLTKLRSAVWGTEIEPRRKYLNKKRGIPTYDLMQSRKTLHANLENV